MTRHRDRYTRWFGRRARNDAEMEKRREFMQRRDELKQHMHEEQYRLERELYEELHKMRPDSRHFRYHLREQNFDQYYSRMRYARPVILIFLGLMWALLFVFGGIKTGLGIAILVFSIFATLGFIVQSLFFSSIRKRVMKPVERLKEGMDKIAGGQYDVSIDPEGAWEVHSLITNFNAMAQKLQENERLQAEYEENRKQLIASISHDLKTPITSVLGYIEAVSETDMPPEKLANYLKIIHNNIAYMNRLIDDLFLFSKLDMQKLHFEFADTVMPPFIADIMEELELELDEKDVSLIYRDETAGSPAARIDSKRFHQVIRNIVDNALKYGDARDLTIEARLYDSGDTICLSLTNNGPAIPEERLTHIFDRFYRLDTARTKDLGSTGLGLAIARELIEAHGGSITAASGEAGTCFTIAAPRLAAAEKTGGEQDE